MKTCIIRIILGLCKTLEGRKLKSNEEIYQNIENMTEIVRKH